MSAKEYRAKSDDDLQKELLDLQREAFNLRMQKGTGQLSRPSQVKEVRRNVARIKTVQNERREAQSK